MMIAMMVLCKNEQLYMFCVLLTSSQIDWAIENRDVLISDKNIPIFVNLLNYNKHAAMFYLQVIIFLATYPSVVVSNKVILR